MNYRKVNINTARKLFNEGKTITVKPCNMPLVKTMWFHPMEIRKNMPHNIENDFDKIINSYFVYNCNSEMGKRLQYFIFEGV